MKPKKNPKPFPSLFNPENLHELFLMILAMVGSMLVANEVTKVLGLVKFGDVGSGILGAVFLLYVVENRRSKRMR